MLKNDNLYFGGVRNSASLRSLPRIRLGHITADKREIKDLPKLPSATSFILDTLYEIPNPARCVNEETFNKTRRMKL